MSGNLSFPGRVVKDLAAAEVVKGLKWELLQYLLANLASGQLREFRFFQSFLGQLLFLGFEPLLILLGMRADVAVHLLLLVALVVITLDMLFDLLRAQAVGLEVFLGVTLDLGSSIGPGLDQVTQPLEFVSQMRLVDRRGILLAFEEFERLQRPGFSLLGFRQVEDDGMGMELRSGIAFDRPGAVMLKGGDDQFPGVFRRVIASHPGLGETLQFPEGLSNAFAVSFQDPTVSSH